MTISDEEAVIVRVVLSEIDGDTLASLNYLEDDLIAAIKLADAGEFDGNELGKAELVLYMYGPNAENLFAAVEATLRNASLMKSASVVIRYGPPGAACRCINL